MICAYCNKDGHLWIDCPNREAEIPEPVTPKAKPRRNTKVSTKDYYRSNLTPSGKFKK